MHSSLHYCYYHFEPMMDFLAWRFAVERNLPWSKDWPPIDVDATHSAVGAVGYVWNGPTPHGVIVPSIDPSECY